MPKDHRNGRQLIPVGLCRMCFCAFGRDVVHHFRDGAERPGFQHFGLCQCLARLAAAYPEEFARHGNRHTGERLPLSGKCLSDFSEGGWYPHGTDIGICSIEARGGLKNLFDGWVGEMQHRNKFGTNDRVWYPPPTRMMYDFGWKCPLFDVDLATHERLKAPTRDAFRQASV